MLTASLDRTCDPYPEIREPIWDGGAIVFAIEDRGNVHVYRVSPEGGEPELVAGGDIVLSGYDAADGNVVRTGSTAPNLGELYAGDRQLTEVGKEFAAGRELSAPERFTAISKDGSEVEAWIARPAGFEEGEAIPGAPEHPRRPVHRSTGTASSTRRRSTPAAATPSSTPTRAAPPATTSRGAARSWARASSGRDGARSTTRT